MQFLTLSAVQSLWRAFYPLLSFDADKSPTDSLNTVSNMAFFDGNPLSPVMTCFYLSLALSSTDQLPAYPSKSCPPTRAACVTIPLLPCRTCFTGPFTSLQLIFPGGGVVLMIAHTIIIGVNDRLPRIRTICRDGAICWSFTGQAALYKSYTSFSLPLCCYASGGCGIVHIRL